MTNMNMMEIKSFGYIQKTMLYNQKYPNIEYEAR